MEGNDKAIVYGIIAACVLGIIVIGALVLITDTSESFSELYFEDHDQLPRIVDVGEEVNFSFTVVSHEKELTGYMYNVTFDDRLMEQGKFALQPGENITVNVTLVPRNSSLVPFDVPRIAVSYMVLDEGSSQIQLPISGASGGAAVIMTSQAAAGSGWNFSEISRVGSPDSLMATDLENISSLGYILRRDDFQIVGDQLHPNLKYVLNETEYRYEFKNVSVSVSSHQISINDQDEEGYLGKSGNAYEIHFWVIVEDNPVNLFDL